MARERKNKHGPAAGDHAKQRHKRDRKGNPVDWRAPLPPGINALPEKPSIKLKHTTYYEVVDNKDKKKKLEMEFTEQIEPPPGFEFVPIGNPALTTACKEISRDQGAMVFIVVVNRPGFSNRLSKHLNRVGYHVRESIVEQARASLRPEQLLPLSSAPDQPEPIPEGQDEIFKQADAAIKDLFPRIPNFDREAILDQSFNKSRIKNGERPVGLAPDISLARRVALAVLAHIRHNHTRYDELLQETSYVIARKAVENLCLEILAKWRGDEETGRDQLDEILREVIVISDSEDEESDESTEFEDESEGHEESSATTSAAETSARVADRAGGPCRVLPLTESSSVPSTTDRSRADNVHSSHAPHKVTKSSHREKEGGWAQRNLAHQARRDQLWFEALERQRRVDQDLADSAGYVPTERLNSQRPQLWRAEPGQADSRTAVVHTLAQLPPQTDSLLVRASQPVDAYYRRDDHPEELRQVPAHPTHYRIPLEGRVQENHLPCARNSMGQDFVWVSHQGQDLKDYLVPSIELPSPELSTVEGRAALPIREREPHHVQNLRDSRRIEDHPHGGAVPPSRETQKTASVYAALETRGFIELRPRSETSQTVHIGSRLDQILQRNPEPVSNARVSSSGIVRTTDSRNPSGRSYAEPLYPSGSGLACGPSSHSTWARKDGALLRSEDRVIGADNDRLRRPDVIPAHVSSEIYGRSTGGVDDHGAIRVGPCERQLTQRLDQQSLDLARNGFIQIAKKSSDQFPKQHDHRSVEQTFPEYESHPAFIQHRTQRENRFTPDIYRHPSAHPQREPAWFVDTGRQVRHHGQGSDHALNPLPNGFQRQERVVGIEYVQQPSILNQAYPQRHPVYDAQGNRYPPLSRPLPSGLQLAAPHQPHSERPVPKNHGIIEID